MSHGITDRDGMFTVRKAAWHGLGTVLADHPTRAEAQAIAHPWEPITEPIYRRVPQIGADGQLISTYEEIEGKNAVVRSDNGETLGVTNDTLGIVSNAELYDIAEALQGSASDVKFETGGSLYGGKKVWLLLRLNEPLVVPGDPRGETLMYYALQNAHDGSGSLRGQALATRIVCDNTAQMADLESQRRGTEFTFRHTVNIKDRVEEAKVALAGWRVSVDRWQRMMEHLIDVKVTKAQQELFVTEFVPMPVEGLISDRVKGNVEAAREQIRGILASPTSEGIDLTAYGLVQASVEYAQHARRTRGNSPQARAESRFRRAYLDRDRLTADAVDLAQQVALAGV